MDSSIEVKILGAGQNWIAIGSFLAIGLDGYYSRLPKGSLVSVSTSSPGEMCMEAPRLVADGQYHMGVTTPGWYVRAAREGKGPFQEPLPLATIAVFHHDDGLGLAVRRETGITSLRQIKEERKPLRISMPTADLKHPAGWVVEEVMARHGFSTTDIESWGGEIIRDRPRFLNSPESVSVDPGFDAIFDEAMMTIRWKRVTDEYDLRFLPIEDDVLAHCETLGMDRVTLQPGRLRGIDEEIPTVDFSGWVLFCREDMDEELGYLTARALDEQQHRISDFFGRDERPAMTQPVDMRRIGANPPVPLHSGVERYLREQGYLT